MSQQESHYEILGVPPQASQDDIRRRYRELARNHHPDVTGGQGQTVFRRITQAYHVLQDPQQRALYDRGRQISLQPTPLPKATSRSPKPPAALLRSPAMQRLLSEAEGDALAEAGQIKEAIASYRDAKGDTPNPTLEAKIARMEALLAPKNGTAASSAAMNSYPSVEGSSQSFWRRWFKQERAI